MRIASLLPAATEICWALGLGDQLVGVSHECDYPPAVAPLPRLTESSLPSTGGSAAIDAAVKQRASAGLSLYRVDEARLAAVRPDLVITQDTCSACAVDLAEVRRAVSQCVGAAVDIVSLSPQRLDEVWEGMVEVGEATDRADVATAVVEGLRERLSVLADRVAGHRRRRVLFLEALDPPMVAGHWTPELLRIAGADPVLAHDGKPTVAARWEQLRAANPELVLLAPCGYEVDTTQAELRDPGPDLAALLEGTPHAVVDGNAYFNRPGPRLVEGAELAARIIHADGGAPDDAPTLHVT